MKRIVAAIVVSWIGLASGTVQGQFIYPLDGQFCFVYPQSKAKVSVSTQYLDSNYLGIGGIYEFLPDSGGMTLRAFNSADDFRAGLFTLTPFSTFPDYLKIRNNGFQVLQTGKDSITTDEKGRVTKAYYTTASEASAGARLSFVKEFYYVNDSIVYELQSGNNTPGKQLYVYELDRRQNLKSIEEGDAGDEAQLNNFGMAIRKIAFWSITRFEYDASGRITKIKFSESSNGTSKPLFTQKFYYKKGRPHSSSLTDEVKKRIVYKQDYNYKPL